MFAVGSAIQSFACSLYDRDGSVLLGGMGGMDGLRAKKTNNKEKKQAEREQREQKARSQKPIHHFPREFLSVTPE